MTQHRVLGMGASGSEPVEGTRRGKLECHDKKELANQEGPEDPEGRDTGTEGQDPGTRGSGPRD